VAAIPVPPVLKNPYVVTILSLALALVLVYLDLLTGPNIPFSFFYFLPIFLAAWYAGFGPALAVALVAVLVRSFFDIPWSDLKTPVGILIWKVVSRALIQGLFAFLIHRLKVTLVRAQEAQKQALEATESKSMFLATMSHEIRTPMNSILAMAELLDASRLDPEQKAWVKIFRKEGGLLLTLLNDLLDFSKIEARQYKLETTSFSLAGLIEEVKSIQGVQAREKGLDFQVVFPEGGTPVVGDPLALRRILFNLIGNAIKFTDRGRVCLTVEKLGVQNGRREWHFQVSDTGMGIPSDQHQLIFRPFTQSHSSWKRNVGGTGLGLSIVRELLGLMGGTIHVESQPGDGSRFDFFLPLDQADPSEGVASPPDRSRNDAPWTAFSLLVADDYETNRLILREFLKDVPCRITEVENGLEAVEAVKQGEYSLVLMDVKMPVMDGFEALLAIRAWESDQSRSPVPIVALTAQAFPEDVQKALSAGFQAHLAKPMDRNRLLSVVRQWTQTPDAPAPAGSPSPQDWPEWTKRYLEEVTKYGHEAVSALASGDAGVLETIGHRLRGSGGVFGFDVLSEVGVDLEAAAVAADLEGMRRAVDRLTAFRASKEVPR